MNITNIFSAIAEFGIMIVISSIFLFFAYRMFERQEKRKEYLENQQRDIISNQQKENSRLLNILLNEMRNDRHSVNKEEKINKIEKQINVILKDLLYTTNSGRAYFIRYHNGGHDLNNLSFLKMSMTNEITRKGVSNAISNFTNQFRAIFPWLIESLATESPVHINELEKVKEVDHSLYEYLKSQEVLRCHGICIRNDEEQIIGFIAISYLTKEVFLDNDKITEILKLEQAKLEAVLSLKDE